MTDPSTVRVSLWDWRTEGWVEQGGQANDERLEWQLTMIDEPDRFVGPNNAIRVRIRDVTGSQKGISGINATYIGRVP